MNIKLSYHIGSIFEIRIKFNERNAKTLFLTTIRSVFFCTSILMYLPMSEVMENTREILFYGINTYTIHPNQNKLSFM